MAKRKRKTSGRSTASRRKNRTQDRMPAGLITLFAGLVLMALAFVPGSSAWRTMHDVLFGVFGCGSFVLGAALCYLAILYTRGQDLLMQVFKLLLGLIFASGTVIVFSDIPADLTAAQMIAACYQNGANAWLGGGVLGTLLGGNLLLLCGRPAANLVMAVLALCASLYIFDITPAECWQWLCRAAACMKKAWRSMNRTPPAVLSALRPGRRKKSTAPRSLRTITMIISMRKTCLAAFRCPGGCPACSAGATR